MNKRVLITGGSGFLGINLVRYLLNKGKFHISVLDIADFDYPEKDKIVFKKGDIRDKELVAELIKKSDIVIHAAAALPLYKNKEIFSVDVEGTKTLLNEAYKCDVERVVYISSTAVYGIPDHSPIHEHERLDGVGPYGKAKILAEKICEEYRDKGMCIPVLRPKTFVGPERLGVFSLLYEWAGEGRNFPILGKGDNLYQLLDVEDLCEAIYLCMEKEKNTANDTFNIGAKKFGTIKEDFQALLDYAGHGRRVVSLPSHFFTLVLTILDFLKLSPFYKWIYSTISHSSVVSTEKAERILGFRPCYSNKEALIRNYKWYTENIHNFKNKTGISHRTVWKQGVIKLAKIFF
ncbi:MAG: NAD-dependent epimerase/dehydratase family protein [Candidatus Aminicenantales bacterium]